MHSFIWFYIHCQPGGNWVLISLQQYIRWSVIAPSQIEQLSMYIFERLVYVFFFYFRGCCSKKPSILNSLSILLSSTCFSCTIYGTLAMKLNSIVTVRMNSSAGHNYWHSSVSYTVDSIFAQLLATLLFNQICCILEWDYKPRSGFNTAQADYAVRRSSWLWCQCCSWIALLWHDLIARSHSYCFWRRNCELVGFLLINCE